MLKTRFWNLYISAYTLLIGVSLLFFPKQLSFISFAWSDEVWVRISGMCILAFSYFNLVIYREQPIPIIRANVINQAFCAVIVGAMALGRDSRLLHVIEGIILIGLIGSALAYRSDRQSSEPEPPTQMPKTALWNVYVTGYTFIYGTATAIFPTQILPLLGFPVPEGAWVRIAGMCFYVLCYFNVVTYQERGTRRIIWEIMIIRVWFVGNLLVMGFLGYPWFLFASAGIVSIGVIGTVFTYRSEMRSGSVVPSFRT